MNINDKISDFVSEIDEKLLTTIEYVGLIGSALMFIVYYQPRLRQLSMSIYFQCLALLCIYMIIKRWILMNYVMKIHKVSEFLASLVVFIPKMFSSLSAWIEVLASLDRFLTILFPSKFKFIRKTYMQLVFITLVFIYNSILNLHYLIGLGYLHWITGIPETSNGDAKIKKLKYLILLVNSSIIPFTIMIASSVATFVGVLRVHRRNKLSLGRINDSQRILTRDIRFGVTMIVLNVLFFICIGLHFMRFIFDINPFNTDTQLLAYLITDHVLMDLSDYYYLLLFYIQFAINSVVRKELFGIFICIFKKLELFFRNKIINLFN